MAGIVTEMTESQTKFASASEQVCSETQKKDIGATHVAQPAASTPDVLDISELLSTNPFDGVEQDQHITLEDLLDKEFMILDIHSFESAKKGAGVYALINVDGETRYICTHSIGLTEKLGKLEKTVKGGTRIKAHIGKRPSQNDKSKKVYYLY